MASATAPAAGACKADVKALCKDVSPGDDRLLLCLVKRMKQAQQGNIAGVLCCPCNGSSTASGRTRMSLVAAGAAVHSHARVRVCVCVCLVCRPASVGEVSAGCCKVQDRAQQAHQQGCGPG